MRIKLFLSSAIIAASIFGSSAQAAVVIDSTSLEAITGPDEQGNTVTFGYSDSQLESPTFEEFVTFTNSKGGIYDLALSTSNLNVDFTRAFITGPGGMMFDLNKLFDQGGGLEFWGASNLNFGPGQFTLNLLGNNRGPGTLTGSVTVADQMAAVPEPSTWMLMLLGMAGVGFSMRRKEKQTLRVRYT